MVFSKAVISWAIQISPYPKPHTLNPKALYRGTVWVRALLGDFVLRYSVVEESRVFRVQGR